MNKNFWTITLYLSLVVSIVYISSCTRHSHIPKDDVWGIQDDLLYDAYSIYIDSVEKPWNMNDTIFLYNKAIMNGCFTYGMSQFSFYYGYVDTTSFPNLVLGLDRLDAYERIQKLTKDTLQLDCDKFFVNDDRDKIKCFNSLNEFQRSNNYAYSQITPLIKYKKDKYMLYVNYYVERITFGYTITYVLKDTGLEITGISRIDDGDMVPCGMAPDSLRTVNMKKLRASLEEK